MDVIARLRSRPNPGCCVLDRQVSIGLMVAVLLFVAGCTANEDGLGFGCESASEDQRHSVSDFPLSVSDNPTSRDATIHLNIGSTIVQSNAGSGDPPQRQDLTGYGSTWQCWTGSEWIDTHLLVHDGETIQGQPGGTSTVPAIGLPVPQSFSVVVPSVDPGWYRIAVGISVAQPEGSPITLAGYVAIEVLD